MLSDHRLIRALFKQPVDRTPVWIMRQAGRYLPEYRVVRKKAQDFLTLCKTPELAAEVTLQPVERFPLDAAIIFSDILTIPDAFKMGLSFREGEGPHFAHPIQTVKDIEQLPMIDPETELRYVLDAIRITKKSLQDRIPLIGFCGSPWTIATYMIEGQASKNFSKIKRWMYSEPKAMHQLLSHLSKVLMLYLNAQIAAGADAIMIFDTWGGLLSYSDYATFSLDYMAEIVRNLHRLYQGKKIPIILFTKNSGPYLSSMAASGCDALGVDWTIPLDWARQLVGDKVALQGNLDPAVLYGDEICIQREVERVLQQFGKGSGHVFNLGHGIYPDIDPEKVLILLQQVKTLSTAYHKT